MKVPGVIGGLGPETTTDFYLHVQKLAIENHLNNRPEMIIGSVGLPFALEKGLLTKNKNLVEYLPYLQNTIRELEAAKVDFLVMPCNTLHLLYEELVSKTNLPILNIVEETIKEVQKQNVKKVSIVATEATVTGRLYQSYLEKNNIEYIVADQTNQTRQNEIISRLVNSKQSADDKEYFNQYLLDQQKNVDAIIFACTDFHLLLDPNIQVKTIDTMAVLAQATYEKIVS